MGTDYFLALKDPQMDSTPETNLIYNSQASNLSGCLKVGCRSCFLSLFKGRNSGRLKAERRWSTTLASDSLPGVATTASLLLLMYHF